VWVHLLLPNLVPKRNKPRAASQKNDSSASAELLVALIRSKAAGPFLLKKNDRREIGSCAVLRRFA
jgi:hypothetical protein